MPGRQFKTDPVGGRRYPIYKSIVAACQVGCFDCGAMLEPGDAETTGRPAGSGAHSVMCFACGMAKEFDVRGD